MPNTDAEKHWKELDRAVPYTKVRSSTVCKYLSDCTFMLEALSHISLSLTCLARQHAAGNTVGGPEGMQRHCYCLISGHVSVALCEWGW